MEFILMQSLDLIYTKSLSVRKNVANNIATIGLQGVKGLD